MRKYILLIMICWVGLAHANKRVLYQLKPNQALVCEPFTLPIHIEYKDKKSNDVKIGDQIFFDGVFYEIKNLTSTYNPDKTIYTVVIEVEQKTNGKPFSFTEVVDIKKKSVISSVLQLYNEHENDNCPYDVSEDGPGPLTKFYTFAQPTSAAQTGSK